MGSGLGSGFEYEFGEPKRQFYTCRKCGYWWEGEPVQVLHLPWPEYSLEFPEPEFCPSCEGPERVR